MVVYTHGCVSTVCTLTFTLRSLNIIRILVIAIAIGTASACSSRHFTDLPQDNTDFNLLKADLSLENMFPVSYENKIWKKIIIEDNPLTLNQGNPDYFFSESSNTFDNPLNLNKNLENPPLLEQRRARVNNSTNSSVNITSSLDYSQKPKMVPENSMIIALISMSFYLFTKRKR